MKYLVFPMNVFLGASLIATKAFSFSPEINHNNHKVSIMLTAAESLEEWRITNDGVMGGLSKGSVSIKNNAINFTGTISTENNGGFTSVFRRVAPLPKTLKSIRILVKGDGNRFQLRVRSKVSRYSLAYKISFPTTVNKAVSHTFKLADLKASFRGRDIENAPILSASTIEEVGFLFTEKQAKGFDISILALDFLESSFEEENL